MARGLPIRAESVSPEVGNDLFVAHLSIYVFAAGLARGRRTLDLGCGTGYGAARILSEGASAVVGVDRDARVIRYARRRYAAQHLRFEQVDAQHLPAHLGQFEFVVCSNVLEHLDDPPGAVRGIRRLLKSNGELLAIVPPITDEGTLRANQSNRFHRSNYFVTEWLHLLGETFPRIRTYRHLPPPGVELDFMDPRTSRVRPEGFIFEEVSPPELGVGPTLGAIFRCSGYL